MRGCGEKLIRSAGVGADILASWAVRRDRGGAGTDASLMTLEAHEVGERDGCLLPGSPPGSVPGWRGADPSLALEDGL